MNQIKKITGVEKRRNMLAAFHTVFEEDRRYNELVFASGIETRALLYPVHYVLKADQRHALAKSIEAVSDNGFYLSLLEEVLEEDFANHIFIARESISAYTTLHSLYQMLENAIYSPTGQWGIKLTMDQYALIGGSTLFIDTFFSHLEIGLFDPVLDFISDYLRNQKRDPESTWLFNLLSHLYGADKAEQLLANAGWAPYT